MKIQSLPSNIKGVYEQWKLLQQLHNLIVEQKWIEGIGLAKELSNGQQNDFFGQYYQGICNTKLKFYEEAIVNFESTLINLKKNKFPWAVIDYEKEAKLRLAYVYRLQRDCDRAIEHLNQLILTFPKYVNAYQSKAGIQIDQNDFNGALETANQGLAQLPNHTKLIEIRNIMIYQLTTKS